MIKISNNEIENIIYGIYDYLYNEIRMRNGAYGAYANLFKNSLIMYTYRDPKLAETYKIFRSIPEHVESIELSEIKLQNFKIGAYGLNTNLESPIEKNDNNLSFALCDNTPNKEVILKELLDTTAEDIRGLAPMLRDVIENSKICTVGNDTKIEENCDIFDSIKNYLE